MSPCDALNLRGTLNLKKKRGSCCICDTLPNSPFKLPLFSLGDKGRSRCCMKPLHPNIRVPILHTVLCTFTKVLTRRICRTIKSFFSW